ncbi:hypothetical protein PM082_019082 [Marasmius tenuissimus]|nr:hypothetical protein PM082_019082 [Marasmius tenuissimus]
MVTVTGSEVEECLSQSVACRQQKRVQSDEVHAFSQAQFVEVCRSHDASADHVALFGIPRHGVWGRLGCFLSSSMFSAKA